MPDNGQATISTDVSARSLDIHPPLLNTACPWATTAVDLAALFACPATGAVTVRTSLLGGFQHDDTIHQYAFFDAIGTIAAAGSPNPAGLGSYSSLNTLGYSPIPLAEYLVIIEQIIAASPLPRALRKPFIVSVTGDAAEVETCIELVASASARLKWPLHVEVNLSCPNIHGRPPPAYDGAGLFEYLAAMDRAVRKLDLALDRNGDASAPSQTCIGIKTPPYTHAGQFDMVINALAQFDPCPVQFVTATNTLGSSLLLEPNANADDKGTRNYKPVLASAAGTGIGGLAGAALHPLALGNVAELRRRLDVRTDSVTVQGPSGTPARLAHIALIGVGGVADARGYSRMRSAGASYVGLATALGRQGVGVFNTILNGV